MPDKLMNQLRAHLTPLYSPEGLKGLGLALIIFALDQLSKYAVLFGLNLREIGDHAQILPFFSLTMVHNIGISFGFLGSQGSGRWLLVLFQFAVALGLINYVRAAKSLWLTLSLGLIIGGAIGNGLDRLRLGYVVDFLDFSGTHIFPWVFNVADSAITIGVMLLIWHFVTSDKAVVEKTS